MFWHKRKQSDFNAEVEAHIALEADRLKEQGLSAEEAQAAARRAFGNITQAQERFYESNRWRWWDELRQDVSYGLRQLRRNPGFTIVAVLTLALGIGANTAIFTLVDAVVLRKLPVQSPGQLIQLRWTARNPPKASVRYSYGGCPGGTTMGASASSAGCSFSYPVFEQIRKTQTGLTGVFAFTGLYTIDTRFRRGVASASARFVSGSFFPVLGEQAATGRLIDPDDDVVGAVPVLVISYAYWQGHFGGDPSVVGKTLVVNGAPFTIAGVSPSGFIGLEPGIPADFWIPLSSQPSVLPYFPKRSDAAGIWLDIGGRLKSNVPVSSARTAVNLIFGRRTTSGPGAIFKPADAPRVDLISMSRGLVTLWQRFSRPLLVLMAAVGIVLLIACVNLASLMLARAANRQREIAVRLAMGAGRWRVARQLFTESALLAAVSGAVGILLAYWGASSLASFLSSNYNTRLQIDTRPDLAVLGFTLAVSVLAAILFGFAPGFFGFRLNVMPALKDAPKGPAGASYDGGRRPRFLNTLVVTQVALSILVLASAGLLVRTLIDLKTLNVGFDKSNLLLFSVGMTRSGTKGPQLQALSRNLQEQFGSLPGVTSVSYSMTSLLSGGVMRWTDAPLQGAHGVQKASVNELPVGPKFFHTMRIPVLAGRTFGPADFRPQVKPQRVIVNQTLARRYFGNENPLGRRLLMNAKGADWEIVGIVQDAKYGTLRAPMGPTAYVPFRPSMGEPTFELRTERDPKALISLVRNAAEKVYEGPLLSNVTTQSEQIDKSLYQERLFAWLSSAFGLLALILVAVGLYGLLSYQVARRTHEIGIRMALGARRDDVLSVVVGQGLKLAVIGVAIGVVGGLVLTRFLASLLYGVKPTDPLTFIAVSLVLIAVALLACYIPARRAAKVDPMVALRYE